MRVCVHMVCICVVCVCGMVCMSINGECMCVCGLCVYIRCVWCVYGLVYIMYMACMCGIYDVYVYGLYGVYMMCVCVYGAGVWPSCLFLVSFCLNKGKYHSVWI